MRVWDRENALSVLKCEGVGDFEGQRVPHSERRISCDGARGRRRATSQTVSGAAAVVASARPRQLHALVRYGGNVIWKRI